MARASRRRLAQARGERRPVTAAVLPHPLKHPTVWQLSLDCGHSQRFVAAQQPKHVRCKQGCTQPKEI